MSFLNPWLLFGLLGVGLPILIHLLNRLRVKTTDWGAMLLLRRAFRVRAKQIKLRDILLMILRCMIILFIVLALSRPTLMPESGGWALGEKTAGVVIALDASYSQLHKPGANSRFDEALMATRQIIKSLKPGQPLSLVLMGNRNRTLLRNAGYNEARVEKILGDLEPLSEGLNVEACIGELKQLCEELKSPGRELYIITDAQAKDWQYITDATGQEFHDLSDLAKIFLVPIRNGNSENLGLTRFELVSGSLRRGSIVRYAATVHNFGRSDRKGVRISLEVNATPVDERLIDTIPAGASVTVPLFAPLNEAGIMRLTAKLDHDELLIDNEKHVVADVRESTSVLCVDGSPSIEAFKGATDYLVRAIQARTSGDVAAGINLKVIPWLGLPSEQLSDYDVVFLANVPEITREMASGFYDFVQDGGGLVMFLGENTDPDLMNERMSRGRSSLLPGKLLGVTTRLLGEDTAPMHLDPEMPDHPLARALSSLPPDLLGEVFFENVVETEPSPKGRTILSVAGKGYPVLLEQNLGRGKVLLFTTSANRQWNNMVINPMYPILVQQSITHLTRRDYEVPLAVGEPVILPLTGQLIGGEVSVEDPDGKPMPPVKASERQGQVVAELKNLEKAGFYKVRYSPTSPGVSMAANVNTAESDLTGLDRGAFKKVFENIPVKMIANKDGILAAITEARVGRELWRMFLLLGLLGLTAEAWYARRRTRGRGKEN